MFKRALTNPTGVSLDHWKFQEKLASPHIEDEALIFTSSDTFSRAEASAWWLAYEAIVYARRFRAGRNSVI